VLMWGMRFLISDTCIVLVERVVETEIIVNKPLR
jgi:hypothetical protein